MKGSHAIRVGNARVQYKFTLNRNLTIVRGDSATGKTTLVDMIAEYEREGAASGVSLVSPKRCTVLESRNWQRDLETISDSFVFIDEGNDFIRSKDFAHAAKNSDNYYVLATRETLPNLPYSVDEIYEIRNVGRSRYLSARRLYSKFEKMYRELPDVTRPDKVIVEDSNAGYEFYRALCAKSGIMCVSAGGKSNVLNVLRACGPDERVLVIADGAAFGPEMELVYELAGYKGAGLFLPESFEWLILNSGIVGQSDLPALLANPSDYIESRDYFSWESFFTHELVERTAGTYLAYKKATLNPQYLCEREMKQVSSQFPSALLESD